MAVIVFTQADVDTVKAAVLVLAANGLAQTVAFGDRSVTFRSLAEAQAFLEWMASFVVTDDPAVTNYRLAATRKGV